MKFSHSIFMFIGLTLFNLSFQNNLSAKNISDLDFVTEIYPPYNLRVDGKLTGMSVDILKASFVALGKELSEDSIGIYPWARAYRQAVSGPNTVLFSTTRTEKREGLFQWVGPISPTRVVLLAKKSKGIKIDSSEMIKKYKIGVLRDDIGEQMVITLGVPDKLLSKVAVANSVIKMMNANRVDLWAYEENAARWFIKQEGFKNEDYDTVYVLKESDLYFTFSPDVDKDLVDELQRGIDLIKMKGKGSDKSTYDKILEKYR